VTFSDCIVVGAGLVGMFAALEMAKTGKKITLIDEKHPEILSEEIEAEMLLFRKFCLNQLNFLRRKNLLYYKDILERNHTEPAPHVVSMIYLVSRRDDVVPARLEGKQLQAQGVMADYLSQGELKALKPELCSEAAGGLLHQNIPAMGSKQLYGCLWQRCASKKEITVLWNTPVLGVVVKNEHVVAVRSLKGLIETGEVLLATGAGTLSIISSSGIQLPVIPQRRYRLIGPPVNDSNEMVITEYERPKENLQRHHACKEVGKLEVTLSVYFRQDQKTLAGDGKEFMNGNQCLKQSAFKEIGRRFIRLMPGYDKLKFSNVRSRSDLLIVDHLPIVGPVPNIDGLFLALYHRDERDMLAPAVGELAARAIMGSKLTDQEKKLSPERFPQTAPGGMKWVID